ncbi:MAG: MurR/RpiR family transcriptional regulator [Clostridiales bacterium]|nr:MurR/RpiR family transcriptional regulator [Clostridiales bacterium]
MTTSDIMLHITSNYSKMTKVEKKVADFVLSSPQKALNATITDLAGYCGVGETSVFRFCKTLNFNGYQEFRLSLALSSGEAPSLSSSQDHVDINNSDSSQEVAGKVLSAYESALKKALSSLDYSAIDKSVQLLMNAEHIYLFGVGGSGISALEMHNKFIKIMPNITFDMDLHQQITKASLLSSGHVAVIFCNSGVTKDSIRIARLCHERGSQVIFITGFLRTPAKEYCDVILLCGDNEGPLEGGSITAKTSQMFMIDILYAEIYRLMGEASVVNKKLTSEAIANKML